MAQKSLFILYNEDDWNDAMPLKNSPETRISFEEFYAFSATRGWDIYRADIDWYDSLTGLFSRAWSFSDGHWQKKISPPRPDAFFDKVAGKYDYILFEKKMTMSLRATFINSPIFRALFDNKFHQYLIFHDWMPTSFLAENQAQFISAIKKIKSPRAVVKLLYGSGGKEVSIGEKSQLLQEKFSFPIIIQEFISTAGVPGFSKQEEIADLRLVFINHEFVYALSRIAKRGSLFTNFHQGASAVLVPEEKIPTACMKAAQSIMVPLRQFEKAHYSLDFMFTPDGTPIFIEMNTTPGFDLLRLVAPEAVRFSHAEKLLDLCV